MFDIPDFTGGTLPGLFYGCFVTFWDFLENSAYIQLTQWIPGQKRTQCHVLNNLQRPQEVNGENSVSAIEEYFDLHLSAKTNEIT